MRSQQTIEKDLNLSPQREQEFLARVEIEIKYLCQRSKMTKLFTELYTNVTGRTPNKSVKLLDWFLDNYRFDAKLDSWVKPEPIFN